MIKIKDIMTKEVVTTAKDCSIVEAAKLMASKSVSSLVVVEKNKPVGIISDSDIIIGLASKMTMIKEFMGKDFTVISPSTRFQKIEKSVRHNKIKRFPVMENDKLVGLITETDVIEATRDFTRFHQIVQEIILAIFGLATAFFLFYFSPLRISILG